MNDVSGAVSRRAAWCAIAAALALACLARPANAHIMPEGQGSTRIVGSRAYTLVAVPVAVLHGFDDDRNGLLSRTELALHGKELERQLELRVRLFDGATPGRIAFQTLLIEHGDGTANGEMTTITLMRVSEWDTPVQALRVSIDVFGPGAVPGSKLDFRAILGDRTENAVYTAVRTEHRFFRGTPLRLGDFARLGDSSLGRDLAFLALIAVAIGFGWRNRRRALRAE